MGCVMKTCWNLAIALVVVVASVASLYSGLDPRANYGVHDLEAAQTLAKGMALMQEGDRSGALEAFDLSIETYPANAFAYFQKGNLLIEAGRVDEAVRNFNLAFQYAGEGTNIRVQSMGNAALTLAKVGRGKEAEEHFTKAFLADPDDRHGFHWLFYRNLGILAHARRDYLTAALLVLRGYELNAEQVGREMVVAYLKKAEADPDEEFIRMLRLDRAKSKAKTAVKSPDIKRVKVEGDSVQERITELHALADSRIVVGLPDGGTHFYSITLVNRPVVKKVDIDRRIVSMTTAKGKLYALLEQPAELVTLEPDSGRITSRRPIKGVIPRASLAVMPDRNMAFFVAAKSELVGLMPDGSILRSDRQVDSVTVDPYQQFITTSFQPNREVGRGRNGVVLVNGMPVLISDSSFAYSQTMFNRYLVSGSSLLPIDMRFNASSNATRVVTSPDGRFVAATGGGGWRPEDDQGYGHGYGIVAYDASDLSRVIGFYRLELHPRSHAFNPVTDQIAVADSKELRVYSLTDSKKFETIEAEELPIGSVMVWSSDGQWLVAAGKENGLHYFSNAVPAEMAREYGEWFKDLNYKEPFNPYVFKAVKPVASLKTFEATDRLRPIYEALSKALTDRNTRKPYSWSQYEPYASAGLEYDMLLALVTDPEIDLNSGTAIYRLRQLLKRFPESIPAKSALGHALANSGISEESQKLFEEIIREDAGQTELTVLALEKLAKMYFAQEESEKALYCLALALQIDCADPYILDMTLQTIGQDNRFLKFKEPLADFRSLLGVSQPGSGPRFVLPDEPKDSPELNGKDVFARSVSAVVMITNGESIGTGTCVLKPGIILTNAHVVGDSDEVKVTCFEQQDGRAKSIGDIKARIIYLDKALDLALIAMPKCPKSMTALAVSENTPKRGTKVYAIGHPGLGGTVLDNTLSDGIVSSPKRTIEGKEYIQHTAAINAGNSGGPLLDSRGHLVGINTSKGNLDSVGFAIAATKIREFFDKINEDKR